MKYLRRHNLNIGNILDDTVLQRADGNIEFNPTQKVIINGDLEFGPNAEIPGPEVTNVLYVTLDGDDTNTGKGEGPSQAKRTIKAACAVAQQGTTIFVRSGEYFEDNPIRVPPRVSIMGDNLRTTIIRPLNNTLTYTITNVSRAAGLVTVTTLTDHGLDSSSRVRVDCDTVPDVNDTDANVIDVPTTTTFRYKDYGSDIVSTAATGTVKRGFDFFHVNSADYITQLVFKGLQAPAYCVSIDSDAIVDTSPYLQNCSNINGPWLRNGVEWLPFQTTQPDVNGVMVTGPRPLMDYEIQVGQVGTYGVDIDGAGGGMLIDGDKYNSESPIKSMVGDAFTMVSQGGIGFHITNFGYMQLVSCFAVFCSKGFYTTKGGYLSISNSVCDFGTIGFEADGFYPTPYASGLISAPYYSTVGSISLNVEGAGYTSAPTVIIEPPTTPGGNQATATAVIDPILQKVVAISVDNAGSGYDFQPTISFSGGGTPTVVAIATVNLSKNLTLPISQISSKPQVSSIMFLGNDPTGYYISATTNPSLPFVYDEIKCRRDVGYILDAVLGDMVLNTNHQSVYAGLSYLRSYSSTVTSLQKSQTIAGINKAKADTLNTVEVSADATAITRITTLFDAIVNIINFGSSLAPAISLPNTLPREPGFAEAADLLIANKAFIKAEIPAWIALNYPALAYNVATCQRDIEFIIDSMAFDLKYEGNSQTRNAALAYGSGAVIAGQVEETQDAYEYWQTIIGQIVKSQIITPTVGNTATQITGSVGSPIDPNGPSNTAEHLLGIIIDVIDHGTGYVPELTVLPEYSNGDAVLLIVRNAVYPQISTIQDSVINFLNTTYGGSITVTTFPPVQAVTAGTEVLFHSVSTVSTASTALEYVGAGVTYNALPFFGGEPVPANERVEINNGRCFTVTSDQIGNYRIGEFFTVNAITGEVSIDAENINLQGLGAIGPFKRNGIPVGVQLREVSNNTALTASTGLQDTSTVPTQFAVATYVENIYLNKVASVAQTVESDIAFIGDVEIRGGDLTTNQTTFNLLNATATTVNAFGAAATIEIGAATGTLTINNNKVVIDSTASLQIPVGDISQRPSPTALGQIRYNSEISTFEGYGPGGAWGSLGGVRSVDGLTQITAESAPGASDDILRFFAADVDNVTSKLVVTLNNASLTVLNTTESTDKDTGALIVEGGAGIEKNLNVGGNTIITGNLAVNGGNLTTSAATFNLANVTSTTVNFAGAATDIQIGSATGVTNVNNNLDVDGDVNIRGGDLTVTTTTFNLANNVATTGNLFGAATDITIGAATGTSTIRNADTVLTGDLTVNGGDINSNAVTFNVLPTVSTTVNAFGAASALNLGATNGITTVRNNFEVDLNTTLHGTLTVDLDTIITGDLAVNGGDLTTSAATFNLLNTNATTVNFAGAATDVQIGSATGVTNVNNNLDVDGDVNIDGGDLTVSTTTFNLANTTATAINAFGAATDIQIGAATGTTNVNNDLDVDGDINIDGGDLTASTTTFNIANTIVTTGNLFGIATGVNVGTAATSAGTLTYGPAITGNIFKIRSTANGAIDLTTDVISGTVNIFNSVTGTVNIGQSGTINIGTSATAITQTTIGGAVTGNTLKIAGTASGTAILNSDVTTGTVNLFNNITTGTLNIAGAGANTVNLGSAASTVNIGVLTLATDLAVQYGGTGRSTFTANGVIYGNTADGLLVTAASLPGSNAATSFGVLTTDINNVPVWTDVIDGGSY